MKTRKYFNISIQIMLQQSGLLYDNVDCWMSLHLKVKKFKNFLNVSTRTQLYILALELSRSKK